MGVRSGNERWRRSDDDELELRGRVGDRGRYPARAPAVTQGDRNVSWREFDRGADGVARYLLDLGRRPAGQGRHLPLQLPRVPPGLPSPPSRSGWCRSTPTTATATTSSVTSGTTPTPWRWCSTGRSPNASSGSATGCPACRGWLWVDDGTGPCPDWATPYDDAAKSATDRVRRARGAAAATTSIMIYTGGTTGMPKGVMWRQDDLFARLIAGGVRHYPTSTEGSRRCAIAARPTPSAHHPACRRARSCTAPGGSPPTPCWPRADGSCCSRAASTTRSSCSIRWSARR